jgi:hypothetical protein
MPKRKSHTVRAKIVREVTVHGTQEKRRVFYVRKQLLCDDKGRPCPTPLELGNMLSEALKRRDKDAVAGFCLSALNFVHNGEVPENWADEWKEHGPIPLAI